MVGRFDGLLLPDPGPPSGTWPRARARGGEGRVRGWRRATLAARARLAAPLSRCGLEPRDTCWWPQDDSKALLREYDAREAGGVAVSWLTRRQVTAVTPLDVPAAMRVRDGSLLDPYRACLGLAAAAAKRGAIFFEQTPAQKVRVGRRHVEIVVTAA